MDDIIKKIVIILIVAFLLYYLFTRPAGAADAIQSLVDGIQQIGRFFERLAS